MRTIAMSSSRNPNYPHTRAERSGYYQLYVQAAEVRIMAALLQTVDYGIAMSPWVIGPVVLVLWLSILLPAKRRLLDLVRIRLAKEGGSVWVDAVIDATSPALTVAVWVGGLAILDRILPLSARADRVFAIVLTGGVTLALVIFIERIADRLLLQL